MTRAALRRALAAAGPKWETLPNGVDVRKSITFVGLRWSFVIGHRDDGQTITNKGEGSAGSLAAAVRMAELLAAALESQT